METVSAVIATKRARKSSQVRRYFFSDVGGGLFLNMSWWKHVGFIQAVNGKDGSVKMSLGFTHTPHIVHFKVDNVGIATKLVARIKKLHFEKVPVIAEIPSFAGAGLKDFVSEPQPQEQAAEECDSHSDSDSDSDSK
ncbi:hypothetical protein HDU78_009522 [Chytriomyces hyalinus]|nr:hypothetical protein HDU78_009522 [Chytriomyces hyalinus]